MKIKHIYVVCSFCLLGLPAMPLSAYGSPVHNVASQAGPITLKGKVLDNANQAVPMATIRIEGLKQTIIADVNGNFTIDLPKWNGTATLTVSYVGMHSKKVVVSKPEDFIKIVLEDDANTLDEVVATGMVNIRRESLTGSTKVITSKDLRTQGFTGIDKLLDGMVGGLNSTTTSGAPGSRAKITIRGENSLNGNTEPLWVVDGLPMLSGVPEVSGGNFAATIMQDGVGNIMPQDIESISILKDAAAASIYGAQAANGVIVITTKKGFRSKTQINYSGTATVGFRPNVNLGMMNSAEKLEYEKMIIDNFGVDQASHAGRGGRLYRDYLRGYITKEDYEKEWNALRHTNTDWMKEIFRTAFSNQHNVNLRGGTEELSYYTSASYMEQQGILRANSYKTMGLLLNMDYRPSKKWIFSMNIGLNERENKDHASAIDPFKYAIFANPYEKPFDSAGNYASDWSYLPNNFTTIRGNQLKYDTFNIRRELEETSNRKTGIDIDATFTVRFQPIERLTLQAIARKSVSHTQGIQEVPAKTYTSYIQEALAREVYKAVPIYPSQYDNGELLESSGKSHNWAFRFQADYNWQINRNHIITLFGAFEAMSKNYNGFSYNSPVYYQDYRITGLPQFENVSPLYADLQPQLQKLYSTYDGQQHTVSFIGSLMYNLLRDRYILNFNIRTDGADVIGNVNRYTPLGSLGFRWNMHKESWFKTSIVKELGLRGSIGYTGNIDRSVYPFSVLRLGSNTYMGNRVAEELRFPNPTVRWEKKRDINLGVDINILNRIFLTAEYYHNRTSDVLSNLNIPPSTGRTSIMANGGITENKGWEVDMRIKWIDTDDILFSTNFNVAQNKNYIVRSLHTPASWSQATRNQNIQGGVVNLVGHETGSVYGWKFAGVNSATGNPQYYLTDEAKLYYAAMLDGWVNYSESTKQKYLPLIKSFNAIPDVIDYVNVARHQYMADDFFLASMQYLGRTNPLFTGGFGTYFKYRNFEFTTNWTFKTGHIVMLFSDLKSSPNAGSFGSSNLGVSQTNREKKYLGFWKKVGDETNIPRFTTYSEEQWSSNYTSEKFASGNYLRMTNLSLSYRFGPKVLEQLHLTNLSLSMMARNLITFTKYRGLDVATQGAFNYPISKEVSFKVTLGI